ncbi:MAG TPA: multidrug ABC transporter substrate-binding protein [Solibacterales bacterium]|nr:multidrug ABC transporter substrate-binding protein [Bryobacterales bacterium]
MEQTAGHVRHAVRRLLRSPLFTGVTVLTLAIGIGANSAIFSVVNGVLLKPLPYPDSDRVVAIWQTIRNLGIPEINGSPATYFLYRENNRVFEDVGLWRADAVSVTGVAEPEQVRVLSVTDGTLPLVGIRPILGRTFTRKDDSPESPESVVLAEGYWRRRFGADRQILGRRILLDGRAREVIGVVPDNFAFAGFEPSMVLPLRFERAKVFIGNFSYMAVARLRPGVTLPQANADVARMLPMITERFPPAPGMSKKMIEEAGLGPAVRPLKEDVVGDVARVLWVLLATVGILLFIACANVANLMLARTEARQHELAIRMALGAGWTRIVRELLTETVALAAAGGALGLALAYGALRLLAYLAPGHLPRRSEIAIDWQVLLFTVLVSLATGLLFGLIPALKYARRGHGLSLRAVSRTHSDGRERHRARGALVVVQVSLALVLLIGSGLMLRTFAALRTVHPGFTEPRNLLTVRITIPRAQVPEPVQVLRMQNAILDRLAELPGVASVAATNAVTMDGSNNNDPIFAEDRTYREGEIPPIRRFKFVTPGLFSTMGNRLLAGRDFTWQDLYDRRNVVLVSEGLAREFWREPGAAVGKRVRENPKGVWREVIGVVANERDDGVDRKAPAVVYWPLLLANLWEPGDRSQRNVALVIRTPRAESPDFRKEVQRAVWSVNPDLPLALVRTVQDIYERSLARTSFTLVLLAIAGGMALLLGVVGIYGVISYSVSQRSREIGIRIALGAAQAQVERMFVGHGLTLTAVGLAAGLAIAFSLTRLIAALLYEVSPLDPLTYAAVSLTLLAAAALATWLPARRAARIPPVEALRGE